MLIDMRRIMPTPDLFAFAREHGFGITMDGVMGQRCEEIVELGRAGLLGPDLTLIHCNDMPEEGWRLIADAGTKITLATTSEQQLGLGSGVPVIQEALDHGIRPCLSGDVEVCLAGDMFTQMRDDADHAAHAGQGAEIPRRERTPPALINHRDVIAFTTRHAAEAVGLGAPDRHADARQIRRPHRHPRRGPQQHAGEQRHRHDRARDREHATSTWSSSPAACASGRAS